jgi:hypothetical protein
VAFLNGWRPSSRTTAPTTYIYIYSVYDSDYEVVRQSVDWGNDPTLETKVNRWALSRAQAQNAVASDAWNQADPKALYTACARMLPEPFRTLLQQKKPEDGPHTWPAHDGLRTGRCLPK